MAEASNGKTTAPLWEASKENAAPLERGRNVRALERSLQVETPQERLEKEQMVKHYERLVRPSEEQSKQQQDSGSNDDHEEDDDPLIHWLSYIKFHQEAFPSDTHAQFLLMERCTRALLSRPKYANDVRFLRVCVLYADKTSFPGDVFKHLYQCKVGLQTSLFWMAWAWVAESKRDWDFADKVFQKGIAKQAKPLEQLKQRYRQFQRRFAKAMLKQREELLLEQEDDESAAATDGPRRGTLHGLTEDRVRRNDRAVVTDENTRVRQSRNAPRVDPTVATFNDRTAALEARRRTAATSSSRRSAHATEASAGAARSNTTAAFDIFVDNESHHASEHLFDHSSSYQRDDNDDDDRDTAARHQQQQRPLERQVDRHKENEGTAERWNERGGLVAAAPIGGRGSHSTEQPSFSIYMDEECTAQIERDRHERLAQDEQARQIRDERTLRQRTDSDIAEKLARDPMRYVRNPSKLAAEQAHHGHPHRDDEARNSDSREQHKQEKSSNNNSKTWLRCGFDKRLVGKDSSGREMCFEEGRAAVVCAKCSDQGRRGHYNYAGPFFNLLATATTSSTATTRRSDDMDVSMGENSSLHDEIDCDSSTSGRHKANDDNEYRKLPSEPSRRRRSLKKALFRNNENEESMESYSTNISNVNNVSTASSTVHERDAVGAPTSKEEETINTKLAMKELSMMFSSPALGLNDLEPTLEQDGDDGDEGEETATFSLVEGLVDEQAANNSILANDSVQYDENDEQCAPRNPEARDTAMPEFHQSALRMLDGEEDGNHHASVGLDRGVAAGEASSAGVPLHRPAGGTAAAAASGFSIYCDDDTTTDTAPPAPFLIYEDNRQSVGDTATFSILGEALQQAAPLHAQEGGDDPKRDSGDTATLSVLGDALKTAPASASSPSTTPAFQIHQDDECKTRNSAGDTATFSVFGEAFKNLERATAREDGPKASGFSIYVDDDDNHSVQTTKTDDFTSNKFRPQGASSPGFGDISRIVVADDGDIPSIRRAKKNRESDDVLVEKTSPLHYGKLHKGDVRLALRKVQLVAHDAMVQRHRDFDLTNVLSTRGYVDDLPNHSMPRTLMQSKCTKGAKITIADRVGFVKEELGRGTYGTVILLESKGDDGVGVVAVKAQSPTDCLALEYVILKAVEERVEQFCDGPFPFPRALSFLSLSNGGLLGMTNLSQSGINLVDLVNVYKVLEGTQVPELVALHYTIRMLKHVEVLHWRGNILHCDIKPDNWVLSPSDSAFGGCTESITSAELNLVDFGRAVDLRTAADTAQGVNPMDVRLKGETSEEEMACVAMREGLSWSFDADTFGICASAHVLLYGSHIEIECISSTNRWKPRKPLRRYWQKDLWHEFFDTLLNLDEVSKTAFGSRPGSLRDLRKKFEAHVKVRTTELLSLLRHQDRILPSSRLK